MRRMIRGRLHMTTRTGSVGFRLAAEGGYRLFRGSYSGMRVKSASAVVNYHEWKSFTHESLGFRVVCEPEP